MIMKWKAYPTVMALWPAILANLANESWNYEKMWLSKPMSVVEMKCNESYISDCTISNQSQCNV
jgi:hypothetical protein